MDETQAQTLGRLIRQKRQTAGVSTHGLAHLVGVNQASIVRLEQGHVLNPEPDKLRAIAEALNLNLADLLVMAGYPLPTELPSVGPYLRTKYRNLPAEAVEQLQAQVTKVLRQHGIEPNHGPRHGEDEIDDS